MVQRFCSRWVSSAIACSSSKLMVGTFTGFDVVVVSPSPATLMMSTPSLTSRRTSVTISSFVLARTPKDETGWSIHAGHGEPMALNVLM